MKKLGIFLMSFIALAFASCDQFDFEEAIPTAYPQESAMSFEGLTVDKGADIVSALDLNAVEGDDVAVVKTVATPALADGQTIEYIAQVAKDETFANVETLDVNNGNVNKGDLDAAFRKFHGKSPKANTLYIRFAAFVADGSSWVRFGNKDTYFVSAPVEITPIPMDFTVESGYYIIGNMNNWSFAELTPFNHSAKDVYDDPEFFVTFTCDADCYWKIIPQSTVDAGTEWAGTAWGVAVDGDDSMEGQLISENPQAGKIVEAGTYKMTINMMDNTYKIQKMLTPQDIYVIGTPNGWNINGGDVKLTCTTGDAVYVGTVALSEGENMFRFYSVLGDWENNSYGYQVVDEPTDMTAQLVDGKYAGGLVEGKGSFKFNLTAEQAGNYTFVVDLANMTFSMEQGGADPASWQYIYVVGNINGWNTAPEATQGKLTCKDGSGIYSATLDMPAADGTEYSYFRFFKELNGTWDKAVQLGSGAGGDLMVEFEDGTAMALLVEQDESCFVVPAGKYNITVDMNEHVVVFEAVK